MNAPEIFYYWVLKDSEKEFLKFCEGKRVETLGPFLKSVAPPEQALWFQAAFKKMEVVEISSITSAQNELKARAKFWTHVPYQLHRRCELIQSKLKKIPKLQVGQESPAESHGVWTLLEQNKMLLCFDPCQSRVVPEFVLPTGDAPPSQAYKKIWEALGRMGVQPSLNDHCLDLGSCPGGWTWYLKELGTQTVSVDSAPIRADLLEHPKVVFLKKDAFKLDPQSLGHKVDWLFSDIICEPQRLPELLERWLKVFPKLRWVISLKFKGPADLKLVRKIQQLPRSHVVHLNSNKHELTWHSC